MIFSPKYTLLILSFMLGDMMYGQNFIITDGATDNTCSGFFYDSGGQGGLGYAPNENKTYTLCSDGSSGTAIKINFSAFNLDAMDTLRVYDGPTTASTLLGKFSNDELLGLTLSPTAINPGGCLTFNFTSDNNNTGFWEGSISCGNKCTFPTANIAGPQVLRICPGGNIALDGSSSTAGTGNITEYKWFSKKDTVIGSTYNSTFPNPSGLLVELRVTNSLGCTNINKEQVKVFVSTRPDFAGTTGDDSICLGSQACFTGNVTGTTYKEPTPKYTGGSLALPDGIGVCFSSSMTYTVFTPGQKLSNISDFQGVCVNMEHSYVQDLTIKLTCPNGQSTILHNVAGGGRYMGTPVDDDSKPNDMGTCGQYCFTPTAVNGFLFQGGTEGQTIPFGDYKSIQPLTNLLGCPLNGTWTFEVCDALHSDNGFLCSWDLNINPAIIPSGISFTPTFNINASDSTAWQNDPTIINTSANGEQICAIPAAAGNSTYTYSVTNNFGCTYDTTLSVKIFDFPTTDLQDTLSICQSTLNYPLNITVNPAAIGNYTYLWTAATGLSNPNILNPVIDVTQAQPSYILEVTDSGTPGCTLKDTISIQKIPVPTAQFSMDKTFGCVPLTIKFKDNTAVTPTNYHWIFGDGYETSGATDTAVHTYNVYGNKTVTYIISTGDGCTDTTTQTIDASPLPLVLFNVTPPYAYKDYPYFCFQNVTEQGGTSNTWLFGDFDTSNNTSDCYMFPDSVACYNVSLINTNNFGCTDTLTKEVCVRPFQQKIYAPTAFTPNHDGVNDVFTIQTTSIQSEGYDLYIFDRWGNVIFHSTTPNEGWNGKTASGNAQIELYVYMLYYKDEWGKDQKMIGNVSLVR